ncbi:response regulator [Microbacterium amylolyticum]|uniref:DNA-binding NarL/FixJ family response regulator n=1 Tax=Microbacterium amylolyticum TaxID=936337 RepID=A0ABS4ZHP0_9MICO|nr:response regulator transcription factor [Microbacterium amylolyticum]MBP2436792.1 DNA-binding NarL/FixJ family response regulator [Microbacterium amylolyticum]
MREISVVVVDDDKLVRRSLATFFRAVEDITLVGEAADGVEGLEVARATKPDVVMLDLHMPRMGGIEAATAIRAELPDTGVLAITTFGTADVVVPMIRAGASGYLLKDSEPEDIIAAVRRVHAGEGALSPAVTGRLIETIQDAQPVSHVELSPDQVLSDRERDVLDQLALGRSNGEIARALHVSESTVKTHLRSIMVKWGARDRVQILIRAARAGLVLLS